VGITQTVPDVQSEGDEAVEDDDGAAEGSECVTLIRTRWANS
jgi:hypothetical protein